MKRILWCIGIFVMVAAGLVAFDDDELNLITFYNDTGYDIWYIFVSPGDSEYWGPELLGADRVLEDGQFLGFWIHYPESSNEFDIMAIDDDGYTFVQYGFEISDDEEAEIWFEFDDLLEDAPEMEFLTVNVTNETIPLYYFFCSPADSDMWGVDLFDEETILDSDESFSFLIPANWDEVVEYDVLAVDEDMDDYTFTLNITPKYADDDGNIWVSVEIDDLVDY